MRAVNSVLLPYFVLSCTAYEAQGTHEATGVSLGVVPFTVVNDIRILGIQLTTKSF